MNEFKLYTEEYYTARRLANILYRPAMASDITQRLYSLVGHMAVESHYFSTKIIVFQDYRRMK